MEFSFSHMAATSEPQGSQPLTINTPIPPAVEILQQRVVLQRAAPPNVPAPKMIGLFVDGVTAPRHQSNGTNRGLLGA